MGAEQGARIQSANNRQAVATEAGLPQLEDPPTLEASVLEDLTGGDVAEARALLEDFLGSTDEDLAVLEQLRN